MVIKGDHKGNQACKSCRTVSNASDFVFEMQLEAINSLVNDWILILPSKNGKVLL